MAGAVQYSSLLFDLLQEEIELVRSHSRSPTDMNEVDQKFGVFVEVTGVLNSHLNITTIPFGSLGVNKLVGWEVTPVGDIDILIPDEYLKQEQIKLRTSLEQLGFGFKDQGEHEFRFQRGDQTVAFASELGLYELPNFRMEDLTLTEEFGIKFRQLTRCHYDDLYTFLLTCDWRQSKRAADLARIEAIRRL